MKDGVNGMAKDKNKNTPASVTLFLFFLLLVYTSIIGLGTLKNENRIDNLDFYDLLEKDFQRFTEDYVYTWECKDRYTYFYHCDDTSTGHGWTNFQGDEFIDSNGRTCVYYESKYRNNDNCQVKVLIRIKG